MRAGHGHPDKRTGREDEVAGRIPVDQEVGIDGLIRGVDLHLHAAAGQRDARNVHGDRSGGAGGHAGLVEHEVALTVRHGHVSPRAISQAEIKVRHRHPDDGLPHGSLRLLDHEVATHRLPGHGQLHARPLAAQDLRRIRGLEQHAIEPDQIQPLRVLRQQGRGLGGQRNAGEARRIVDGFATEDLVELADQDGQLVLRRRFAVLQRLLRLRLQATPHVVGHRVGVRDQLCDQRGQIAEVVSVEER